MLPAVKVFAVAVLLGGGAVGTFALAGGFGPGGSGSGNGETTAQVAAAESAKPAATEPVAPVPEVTPTPPAAEATRNGGDNAVDNGVQQRASEGDVVPGQQQSGPQPQEVSSDSSKGQEVNATGKANTESVGETRGTSHVEQEVTSFDSQTGPQGTKGSEEIQISDQGQSIDSQSLAMEGASGDQGATGGVKDEPAAGGNNGEVSTPGAKPTTQQESAVVVSNKNAEERGVGSGNTGDSGVVKNTEQTITSVPVGSDAVGTGTDGANTITASGGENASST